MLPKTALSEKDSLPKKDTWNLGESIFNTRLCYPTLVSHQVLDWARKLLRRERSSRLIFIATWCPTYFQSPPKIYRFKIIFWPTLKQNNDLGLRISSIVAKGIPQTSYLCVLLQGAVDERYYKEIEVGFYFY